jgi:hypothetical protein
LEESYAGPRRSGSRQTDWAIWGYSDEAQERKDVYLRDGRRFWRAVAQNLALVGYTEAIVTANPAGIASSGEVYGRFRRPGDERTLIAWMQACIDPWGPPIWDAYMGDPAAATAAGRSHPPERPDHLRAIAHWQGPPPHPGHSASTGPNVNLLLLPSEIMAQVLLREVMQQPDLADQLAQHLTRTPAKRTRQTALPSEAPAQLSMFGTDL